MNCGWCHNPETISPKPNLLYYQNNCICCGTCLSVCPQNALSKTDQGIKIDRTRCDNCGRCAGLCFAGALTLSGKTMKTETVMDEIMQDEAYYRNSGGGVTVSGGEVFMQEAFVRDLFKACRKRHIHTAIETNMNMSWRRIEELLPVVDLVMCDIKILDHDRHKAWTGSDNRPILDNIVRLSRLDIPVIVRTPVIPGVNDSEREIAGIARFLKQASVNPEYYELLNYNPLGGSKYQAAGMENHFYGQKPLPDKAIRNLAAVAGEEGINVRIG